MIKTNTKFSSFYILLILTYVGSQILLSSTSRSVVAVLQHKVRLGDGWQHGLRLGLSNAYFVLLLAQRR